MMPELTTIHVALVVPTGPHCVNKTERCRYLRTDEGIWQNFASCIMGLSTFGDLVIDKGNYLKGDICASLEIKEGVA